MKTNTNPFANLKLYLTYFISVFMILFGLTMIFGFIIKMSVPDQKYSLTANIAGVIIVGIIPAFFGTLIFISNFKKGRHLKRDLLENAILNLAKQNEGKLTVTELAMATSLSVESAKEYLENMLKKGEVDLLVSESGIIVYKFKMIIPENEKNNAEKL